MDRSTIFHWEVVSSDSRGLLAVSVEFAKVLLTVSHSSRFCSVRFWIDICLWIL